MSGTSGADASGRRTDEASAPVASPFTMVTGAPDAMVCEGDVCFVPGV